jgi:hypothetical protein
MRVQRFSRALNERGSAQNGAKMTKSEPVKGNYFARPTEVLQAIL